jgi:hypothetical protein
MTPIDFRKALHDFVKKRLKDSNQSGVSWLSVYHPWIEWQEAFKQKLAQKTLPKTFCGYADQLDTVVRKGERKEVEITLYYNTDN